MITKGKIYKYIRLLEGEVRSLRSRVDKLERIITLIYQTSRIPHDAVLYDITDNKVDTTTTNIQK